MLSLVKGFVERSGLENLSLMELGVLGVKVEEKGEIFQFAAEFGFHSQLLELNTL